ncbi:cytochrome d ubiquinol oxidase subunit II [Actinomadura decatromicini]|uniref:Cytochrome d ubiquinol oxidase subunit II n=1 Tax=Actinomadura decatromicini TaxID=2604572 RepID=A0A5D3FWM6_9ACTN|nr:cytochrome d ubiquinol oxidase subunit II [Actinomadura decatromicini]TYK52633.1 cytochrome d ubiquinol oxidase subunit II [Actinomadura decatromicini]
MGTTSGHLDLQTLWFALIAVLWIGFFLLDGIDFGVGMLYPFLGRDDPERHALLATILPVWDSYEVWIIVAGGATFAAFPGWYASMFSGFYLVFFAVLVALIVRGVAIEYRNKHSDPGWRRRWDVALPASSAAIPFLLGVVFAKITRGVPMDARGELTGGELGMFDLYSVLAGLALVVAFALHGALFLAFRTKDGLARRARRTALALWPAAAALLIAFVVWTAVQTWSSAPYRTPALVLIGLSLAAAAASGPLALAGRVPAAFAGTSAATVLLVAALFARLYPRVLVSSTAGSPSLTIYGTASNHYSLVAMTIITAVFLPVVLAYQFWALWVFRARLSRDDFARPPSPLHAITRGGAKRRDGDGPQAGETE